MSSNFEKRIHYAELRRKGIAQTEAAREAGISVTTAWRVEQELPKRKLPKVKGLDGKLHNKPGRDYKKESEALRTPAPKPHNKLKPEAQRALEDFAYMQRRYLGRIPVPWQAEAAQEIVQRLESPEKEYVVVNAPPGSGKSTLFTHDVALWVTIRNRGIRGLIGSASLRQAVWYTGRVRRTLEARIPIKAEPIQLQKGLAVDAEATFIQDFGRFKPDNDDIWRREEFIVEQLEGQIRAEKEATWSAFGMDSEFLGGRYDLVLWDDVYTGKIKTWQAKDDQRRWWTETAETRLDPAGLLVLQGQRMDPEDIYHFALGLTAPADDDDDDDVTQTAKKYHHIIYKAHYDDRCIGEHKPAVAKPYPEGCLLYPARLPWRELRIQESNNPRNFQILYQQEDVDPAGVLVNPLWVSGGEDEHGYYPGCWDSERAVGEYPALLQGDSFNVCSVDPSPTQFWSVQQWLYHPESEFRYLINHERRKMEITEFLDWDYDNSCFVGLMEEWQTESEAAGRPIQYWIIEVNAAARFMVQHETMKRWMAKHGTMIIPHTTHRNKSDPEFGVQSIATQWKTGRVRLPGSQRGDTRLRSMRLVEEVTRYPNGRTDDAVMAEWFFEWNLPNLYSPVSVVTKQARPSWMKEPV